MKYRILMTAGFLCAAITLSGVAHYSMQVKAETDNSQAELYRFLETTRDAANEQGYAVLGSMSKQYLDYLGLSSEDASEAFINSLLARVEQNKKITEEDVVAAIEAEKNAEGVPFVDEAARIEQQMQMVTAISSLTDALNNTAVTVENVTEDTSTSANPGYDDSDSSESRYDTNASDNSTVWTEDDLAEIAMCEATSPNVPDGDGNCDSCNRSYMPYTAVTSETSPQYALLRGDSAYTDPETGFRMVDGRYCIAVGSGYTAKVGTKIDLVMKDGTILKCILGDCKADKDTDSSHRYCVWDGSVAEFIVDYDYFNRDTKRNPVNEALGVFCAIEKVVVIK